MKTAQKAFKISRFIQKFENGAMIAAGATIMTILAHKALYNKGFTYKKLLKNDDICSLITNVETLLIESPHVYEMLYDPDENKWYFTVMEGMIKN